MPWSRIIPALLCCQMLSGPASAASATPGGGADDPGVSPGTGGVLPLPTATGQISQAQIISVLIALQRGDAKALAALPVDAFTNPPIIEADAQQVQRRWTSALPGVLATLDADARHAGHNVLDQLYQQALQALPTSAPASLRARLAVDFSPAPAAIAALMRLADLAFDHGRFLDFLGIEQIIADADSAVKPGQNPERIRIALILSGHADQVDPALRFSPPGPPEEAPIVLDDEPAHRAIRWHLQRGWLLACDPWDQVLWQVRTDPLAHVTPGDGFAVIQDSVGLRAITDTGTVSTLNNLPASARVLCVAGGAAWFAIGAQGWRLRLADDTVQRLDFGAQNPVAPPLVRGDTSLWLTAEDVLFYVDDHLQARVRHGLPVDAAWHLATERKPNGGCVIVAPDGRTWRLETLEEQIARADGPYSKALIYCQASRYQDSITILSAMPTLTPEATQLLILDHLSLGGAHVLTLQERLLALASDPGLRLRVLQACVQALVAGGPADAARERARAQQHQEFDDLITQMAKLHPDLMFSPCSLPGGSISDFSKPPASWPYVLSGVGYLLAEQPPAARAPDTLPLATLLDESAARPASQVADGEDHRQGDGSTHYLGRVIRLEAQIHRRQITCLSDQGSMLWKRSWGGLPVLSAPGCQVLGRDQAVIVIEGQRRLQAFALDSGELLIEVSLANEEDAHGDLAIFASSADHADHADQSGQPRHGLALLGPPGVNTRLTLYAPTRSLIELGHPARWIMPLRNRIVVCFQDGSARLYPGAEDVVLPKTLRESQLAPITLPAGVVVGTTFFPWRRP